MAERNNILFFGKGCEGKGKAHTMIGNGKKNEFNRTQGNKGGNGTGIGPRFRIWKGKYIITFYRCGVNGAQGIWMFRKT